MHIKSIQHAHAAAAMANCEIVIVATSPNNANEANAAAAAVNAAVNAQQAHQQQQQQASTFHPNSRMPPWMTS